MNRQYRGSSTIGMSGSKKLPKNRNPDNLGLKIMIIEELLLHYRLQDHPHCGVVCGPHRTVRTAPTLKAQKSPHNHNFPTIHFNLFCQFLEEKNFSKRFLKFFCQNIEKNLTNDLCGWCAGVDNTTLKNGVVVRSAQPH